MNKRDLSYKLYEAGVIAFEDYQCVDCGGSNVLVDSFYACAVEIKAAAGRDGYLQGHLDAAGDDVGEWSRKHSEYHAKQYADSIRRGEVK